MPATPMPMATKSSLPYGNGNGNSKTSALPPRPSNKKLVINQRTKTSSISNAKGRCDTNPPAVATATVSRSTTKRLPDTYRSYNAPDNDLYIPNKTSTTGHLQGKAVLHQPQHPRPMSLCSFPPDNNNRSLSLSRANKAVDVNVTNGINELGYGFRSFPGGGGSSFPSSSGRWLWQKSLSEGNLADKETPLFLDQDLDENMRYWKSKSSDRNKGTNYGDRTTLNSTSSTRSVMRENKSLPGFFRSISLRNLLQIGGMNKSRPGPVTVKKVAPPTVPPSVPGLVSFSSFRVKKTPANQSASSDSSSVTLSGDSQEQRYSGSSLGSAGSSYTSSSGSGSGSSSSSSDNRSSIGTDDGYILPSPNGYALKSLDEGIYSRPPNSGNNLKNSASFDSFTPHQYNQPYPTTTTTVEMHQSLYGKTGGSASGSNGSGSQHVTVQVDPHYPSPGSTTSGTSSPGILTKQHSNNVFSPAHHHHHTSSHYQTQISMEDQGIDMTQSPGRESPSSTASSNTGSGPGSAVGSVGSGSNGCRHSTSSFDSGRASSTIYQGVRHSGLSSESSSGSFRHSYHSSNSSLGSIAPEDICNFDVSSMIAQGIPDHEVLNTWLTGVHFECYYQNFIQAGYDIHTISRMTPEDLNAIGVTKPHHRKRLKSEISQLSISDGLPDYIPGSIEEWLGVLKLEEYHAKLRAQGYHTVRQVTNITWEDLEDIGILKLGHQKKFMLAIKRVEDILAGKRLPQPNTPSAYLTPVQDSFSPRPLTNGSGNPGPSSQGMPYAHPNSQGMMPSNNGLSNGNNSAYPFARGPPQHQIFRQHPNQIQPQTSGSSIYGQPMTLTHQPQLHNQHPPQQPTPQYHPEVISIHVKNGGRRNSVENVAAQEPIYGTSSFLPNPSSSNPPAQLQPQSHTTWQRSSGKGSYEVQDGDITPTNEMEGQSMPLLNPSNTSTLPRLLKNRPIAKIMGGGERHSMAPANCSTAAMNLSDDGYSSQGSYTNGSGSGDGYKSLPRDIGRLSKAGIAVYNGATSGVQYTGPNAFGNGPAMSKNGPPPPPRRGSCSSGEGIYGQLSTFQNPGGGGYSGWTTQFPPPPPTLSCDVPYGSISMGKSLEDLPLPPHPSDLVIMQSQSHYQYQQHPQPPHPASSSNNASTGSSSSSSPNNPVTMVTTNPVVHYHAHHASNGGSNSTRASPPNKSRDPSPVGSDFSDSDLPNNGLMSRGVRRNGSDASFKSNSSTESESIPFANDNAGTIKQQKASSRSTAQFVANAAAAASSSGSGSGDVLNDIGNMLADLTDELDAILEQEIQSKR